MVINICSQKMSVHAAINIHIKQYKTYTATCWLRIIDLLRSWSYLYFLLCFSPPTCAVFTSFPRASNFTIINCTSILVHIWKCKAGGGGEDGRLQNSQKLPNWEELTWQLFLTPVYILPSGNCGFFKSSSLSRLSSSIRSSLIWTLGELFVTFLIVNEEPIFHTGFLALTCERRRHWNSTNWPGRHNKYKPSNEGHPSKLKKKNKKI